MTAPPPSPEPHSPARGSSNSRASRHIRSIGSLLALVSVMFVAQRLLQHIHQFQAQLAAWHWGWLALAVIAFTASQLLLSYAWYFLLRWQGSHSLRATACHTMCGLAQLSKYIPGNVFQYVARHLAFRRLGVKDGALMLAAAYETLSFVVAAGFVSAVGLPFYAERSTIVSPGFAVAASLVAVTGLGLLVRYGRVLLRLVGRAPPSGSPLRVRQVLRVVPLYAVFLGFSGLLALVLFRVVGGTGPDQLAVIPAYSLAWLCGYVIPGASGGLGIREATLLVLLGDTPEAVFVSIGMRVVTTLGDVLWFTISLMVVRLQRLKP